jgi:hypothetical protein
MTLQVMLQVMLQVKMILPGAAGRSQVEGEVVVAWELWSLRVPADEVRDRPS